MGKATGASKSPFQATALLCATGIGTGILVLPSAMAAVGYMAMFGILLVGGVVSSVTTWILFMAAAKQIEQRQTDMLDPMSPVSPLSMRLKDPLLCSSMSPDPTYADLLVLATNKKTATFLEMCVVIYGLGSCITYFIFLADFVHDLPFWPAWMGVSETIVLAATLVFPATLPRRVGALDRLCFLTVVASIFMSVCIWIRLPETASVVSAPILAVNDLSKVPASFCVVIFAYVWHTNCVAVACELVNPTPLRAAVVAFGGSLMMGVIYALIALGGYLSWGNDVEGVTSIVSMYARDDWLFVLVRASFALALVIAIIVNLFPVRDSVIGLIQLLRPSDSQEMPDAYRYALSFGLVAFCATLAIEFPHVVSIITCLGGTTASFLMIVFPAAIGKGICGKASWLVVMVLGSLLSVFLVCAGFGVIGTPV